VWQSVSHPEWMCHVWSQALYLQPSERDQIVSFEPPDLYHRSPECEKMQCKPRELKKVI